jgi:hypothetical protein
MVIQWVGGNSGGVVFAAILRTFSIYGTVGAGLSHMFQNLHLFTRCVRWTLTVGSTFSNVHGCAIVSESPAEAFVAPS